jgi:hypothetical protein
VDCFIGFQEDRERIFADKLLGAGAEVLCDSSVSSLKSNRCHGTGRKELVAFGRKPADHDQSTFQGIHAVSPFILVDEACGVPKSIFDAVDARATNSNARVLAIGKPDDPSSHSAQICKPGSGWHVITVSAFRHADVHRREGSRGPSATTRPT